MSREGQSPTYKRVKLTPQSSDPSNVAEGHLHYADGTARTEGVWAYDGSAWQPVGHNAGFIATDWTDDGPVTIGATTTPPTKPSGVVVDRLLWKRDGKDLVGRVEYKNSNITGAAAGSGDYLFTIIPSGSGLTIDSSLVTFYNTVEGSGVWSTTNHVGSCSVRANTVSGTGIVSVYDSTRVRLFVELPASGTTDGAVGSGFVNINGSADNLYCFEFRVPITQWATNGINTQPTGVRSVTTTDLATTADFYNLLLCSSSSFTITLPTAVGNSGKQMRFKHNGTSNTQVYTIDGNASETIDGDTTYALYTNGETLTIVSDGSNWHVLDHKAQTGWVDAGAVTIGATTSAPTKPTGITVDRLLWKRDGGDLVGRVEYKNSNTTSAAAGSGDYLFTVVPSGITIDSSKVTFYNTVEGSGSFTATNCVGNFLSKATTQDASGGVVAYDSTQVRLFGHVPAGTTDGVIGSGFCPISAAADTFYVINFRVPITEWKP